MLYAFFSTYVLTITDEYKCVEHSRPGTDHFENRLNAKFIGNRYRARKFSHIIFYVFTKKTFTAVDYRYIIIKPLQLHIILMLLYRLDKIVFAAEFSICESESAAFVEL